MLYVVYFVCLFVRLVCFFLFVCAVRMLSGVLFLASPFALAWRLYATARHVFFYVCAEPFVLCGFCLRVCRAVIDLDPASTVGRALTQITRVLCVVLRNH